MEGLGFGHSILPRLLWLYDCSVLSNNSDMLTCERVFMCNKCSLHMEISKVIQQKSRNLKHIASCMLMATIADVRYSYVSVELFSHCHITL